jgi:branched-chain amino acid transport system substrate-binding protein
VLVRRLVLVGLLAVLALTAVACGSSGSDSGSTSGGSSSGGTAAADSKKPIVIGQAAAETGWMTPYDSAVRNGAKIAADKINAAGGIDGRQIKFVYADTKTDATQGGVAAHKVLQDGADFVLTTCDYDLGAPVARTANQSGKLAIGCAGGLQFGLQGVGPLTFNTYPGSATEGAIMAEWAYNTKGWRKPYLLSNNALEYTKSVCKYFKERWTALAGADSIAGEDVLQGTDASISAQVSRLRQAKDADFVVECSLPPSGASEVRQIRSGGVNLPMLGAAAFDGNYWLKAIPNLTDFYYPALGSIFGDDPDKARSQFFADYATSTGQKPTLASYPLLGYAAVETLKDAIETAQSTDATAVAKAIEGFKDKSLITGPTSYSDKCHIPVAKPYLMMEIVSGKNKFTGDVVTPEQVPPAPC